MTRPGMNTVVVTPVARNTMPVSALRTEFGRLLETVMTAPGVLGVVLSDSGGYAIDYVLDEAKISALDVQLIGAQLGQPLQRMFQCAARHRMPDAIVFAESAGRTLVCATVADEYVVAAMLAEEANVAKALLRFESARARLAGLLEG